MGYEDDGNAEAKPADNNGSEGNGAEMEEMEQGTGECSEESDSGNLQQSTTKILLRKTREICVWNITCLVNFEFY